MHGRRLWSEGEVETHEEIAKRRHRPVVVELAAGLRVEPGVLRPQRIEVARGERHRAGAEPDALCPRRRNWRRERRLAQLDEIGRLDVPPEGAPETGVRAGDARCLQVERRRRIIRLARTAAVAAVAAATELVVVAAAVVEQRREHETLIEEAEGARELRFLRREDRADVRPVGTDRHFRRRENAVVVRVIPSGYRPAPGTLNRVAGENALQ